MKELSINKLLNKLYTQVIPPSNLSTVMADHPLPPAGVAVRAPEPDHSHETPDDGHLSVHHQRTAASAHRDTWHTGMCIR